MASSCTSPICGICGRNIELGTDQLTYTMVDGVFVTTAHKLCRDIDLTGILKKLEASLANA